ncbi:hypothetical protein Bca4012_096450 [Brassica carinata]|uniref:Uncharacterized protein n=1 Tax=Brassica carinata TaxID=52824 RepID=A0A8X7PYH6_BRACI|nr:hypothetical protein Bca52824_078757 [Brassica carinata]
MPASAMYFLKQYPFREVGKMNKGKKKERWERDIRLQLLTVHPLRVLEDADLALSGFVMSDPNQSVKRMIGRGSDPIHNKC